MPGEAFDYMPELVRELFGVALGCNRDELAANISPHGLKPMQEIW